MAWYSTEIQDISPDIGKIEAFMRTTAPTGYLACDGTTYNIGDYPLLEALFTSDFGSVNYFGGNGTTTWKVPDLRGEFLRGAGTNGHSGQGAGGTVGDHQDGTGHVAIGYSYEGSTDYISFPHAGTSTWAGYRNADATFDGGTNAWVSGAGSNANARKSFYTSRPTNTSILYCIKAY